MFKHCFKFICVILATAGFVIFVGCSDNGIQPVSITDNDNSFIGKVGNSGALTVNNSEGPVFAVSKHDKWNGKNHKIFVRNGSSWTAIIDYAMIDAWKCAYDPGTGQLWIIARDKKLWRGMVQQFFTPQNNPAGKTGPIIAHDLTMGKTLSNGNTIGVPFILLDESDKYGYAVWTWTESNGMWGKYETHASGVAIARNPSMGTPHQSDLWVVRDNGELWQWQCSGEKWVKKADNCQTNKYASVTVASDNTVHFLTNQPTRYGYKISTSKNHGQSWFVWDYGISLGGSDKGWMVRNNGNVYKYSGYVWKLVE